MDSNNILICGIGGQGIVLSGSLIAKVYYTSCYDVKSTDIIGVGQRGGGVVTHIRAGDNVSSPLIMEGTADYIVAFEKYEAVRWQHMLSPNGMLIADDTIETPNSVLAGLETDIDIEEEIRSISQRMILIPSNEILRQHLLSNKYKNIFMVGVISQFLSFDRHLWIDILTQVIKEKYIEDNIKAFEIGRSIDTNIFSIINKKNQI